MGQWQGVYDFPEGVYDTSKVCIGLYMGVYDKFRGVYGTLEGLCGTIRR